jgi:hypothetical protein
MAVEKGEEEGRISARVVGGEGAQVGQDEGCEDDEVLVVEVGYPQVQILEVPECP